jgi:hypothetical protein
MIIRETIGLSFNGTQFTEETALAKKVNHDERMKHTHPVSYRELRYLKPVYISQTQPNQNSMLVHYKNGVGGIRTHDLQRPRLTSCQARRRPLAFLDHNNLLYTVKKFVLLDKNS